MSITSIRGIDLETGGNCPNDVPRACSGPDHGRSWDRLSLATLQEFLVDWDLDTRFSAQTELSTRAYAHENDTVETAKRSLL